jgi:hypothetical protein
MSTNVNMGTAAIRPRGSGRARWRRGTGEGESPTSTYFHPHSADIAPGPNRIHAWDDARDPEPVEGRRISAGFAVRRPLAAA